MLYKLIIFLLFFFNCPQSMAQIRVESSLNFDLDNFMRSLKQEGDSLGTISDSVSTMYFRSREECSNEKDHRKLTLLVEELREFDQTNEIDTSQVFRMLFEVELFSSMYQNDFESLVQGSYCIHSESKSVEGKQLVSANLQEDSEFHFCTQMNYTLNDSFLIIRKSCVRYGNMTDFYTEFVRFYEVIPSD